MCSYIYSYACFILYIQSFGNLNSGHLNNTGILMVHGIRPNDIKQLDAAAFGEIFIDNLEGLDQFFAEFPRGVTDAIVRRVRSIILC